MRVEEIKPKIIAIHRGNHLSSLNARGSKSITVVKLVVKMERMRSLFTLSQSTMTENQTL
nr:hypothetical protein [Hyella patelloides]